MLPINKEKEREFFVILVLTCVQIIHIVDAMLIMPLGPQFMRIWDVDAAQFGVLISVYTSCATVSAILCALLINQFDRRSTLIFLYSGFIISVLCCVLAYDYKTLVLARGLSGFFGGVLNAIVFSIIADIVPETRRGFALGKIGIAFPLSSVAGVPLGMLLANTFDWHAPYYALLVLSLIVGAGIFKWIPSLKPHTQKSLSQNPIKQSIMILSDRNHLKALALVGILFLGGFSVIPFIAPYMVLNVGLKEADLPLIYFCGGLAAIFTSRIIGKLCDRHGKIKIFTIVALISIVPIIISTNLPPVPLWLALTASTFFMIFVSGRFIPAMAIISSAAPPHLRAGFMSFNSASQQLAMSIATISSALIIGSSSSGSLTNYWIVGLISVTCTITSIFIAIRIKTTN